MQLRRLVVRNIRSYVRADLRLGMGVTLLAGDVGVGKTSLLYAIEMALFGFAEVDPAYLVRHQASQAEVTLTLEGGGTRAEVRRRFKRQTRRGRQAFVPEENSFLIDGARTTYSATELRQRTIDLLGFPDNPNPRAHSDFWRWAVYIPQERMRDVLQQDPEERLETVRKALGVERYRHAAENASELSRELNRLADSREDSERLLTHFEEELPGLLGTRREAEEQLVEARRREKELQGSLARVTDAVEEAEAQVARLALDRQELRQLERRQAELRAQAARKGATAASRDEEARTLREKARHMAPTTLEEAGPGLELLSSELASARERLTRLDPTRQELAVAQTALLALEAEQRRLGQELPRRNQQRAALTARWDQLREQEPIHEPKPPSPRTASELDRLLKEGSEHDALSLRELTEAQHESADLAALREGGVCPRCHQRVRVEEFAQHEREAQQRLARCAAVRADWVARTESLQAERALREQFERAMFQWEGLERERKSARSQMDQVDEEIRHLEEQNAEMGGRVVGARARLASLEPSTREYASVQSELNRLEKLVDQAERGAAQRREAAETARRLEENAAGFEAEAQRIRDESAELEAEVALAEVSRSSLTARLEKEAPVQARAEQLREQRKELLAKVAPSVEQRSRWEVAVEQSGRDIARAEEGVAQRRRLRSDALHLRKLADWVVGPFREALLQIERRLLTQAQREFDRMFSRYFATLVEDPSLQARSDSAFTPTVEIEGEWTPAEALSGGERTALALAFRLALGAVVRQLGRLRLETIILDEPTDGFSPEQVVRMGELLRELGIPQILLVSHEAQLAGIADRVVRVEKDSGESRLVEAATDRPAPGTPVAEILPPSEPKGTPRRRLRRAVPAPTPGNGSPGLE